MGLGPGKFIFAGSAPLQVDSRFASTAGMQCYCIALFALNW